MADVSVGGAFFSAFDAPPVGARLTFTFETTEGETEEKRRIEFQGEVTRSVPTREGTGFAVRWIQARTYGTSRLLRQFLRGLFGIDMLVYRRKTGHVAWTPAARGASGSRAIARQPEAAEAEAGRPPERSIAVVTVHMGRTHQPVHLEERLLPPNPTSDELPDWALQPLAPTSFELFEGSFEPPEATPPVRPELDGNEPRDNVIRLVPRVGQERRGCDRHPIETRVHFRLNATTLSGTVVDISETGLRITTDERRMPRVGDLLACRYPIPELPDHNVRLVGKVVRQDGDNRPGFAIALLRIDDRDMPGAFENHLCRLS